MGRITISLIEELPINIRIPDMDVVEGKTRSEEQIR